MCEPEPRGSKLRLHTRRDKRPVDSAITARRAQKHAVEQRPTEAGAARPHAAIVNVSARLQGAHAMQLKVAVSMQAALRTISLLVNSV